MSYFSVNKVRNILKKIIFAILIIFQTSQADSITPKNKTNINNNNSITSTPLKLAVFFTRPKNDPYYSLVLKFANHVAKDFNIRINSYYTDHDHLYMLENIEKIASSEDKPDAIAFVNFKNQDTKILKIIEKHRVPTFIFNSISTETNHTNKYFVSTVAPDDEKGGYDLANYLIKNSKKHKDGKIYFTGLEGDPISNASIMRKKGALRAIKEQSNIVFQQIASVDNWSKSDAAIKSNLLLSRYPITNVFWAASDSIALGIHQTLQAQNKLKNVVIGGIDWSFEGIDGVKNNKLKITYGNQFMELGWVSILVYDLLKGQSTIIPDVMNIPMQAITKDNLKQNKKITTKECWNSFDFKKLSKTLNPNLSSYLFEIEC